MGFFMVFAACNKAGTIDTMRGRLMLSWYLWRSADRHIDDRIMSHRVWVGESQHSMPNICTLDFR